MGHETPDRDIERETKDMGYTRREMERMENSGVPWSRGYAPGELTGISQQVLLLHGHLAVPVTFALSTRILPLPPPPPISHPYVTQTNVV